MVLKCFVGLPPDLTESWFIYSKPAGLRHWHLDNHAVCSNPEGYRYPENITVMIPTGGYNDSSRSCQQPQSWHHDKSWFSVVWATLKLCTTSWNPCPLQKKKRQPQLVNTMRWTYLSKTIPFPASKGLCYTKDVKITGETSRSGLMGFPFIVSFRKWRWGFPFIACFRKWRWGHKRYTQKDFF